MLQPRLFRRLAAVILGFAALHPPATNLGGATPAPAGRPNIIVIMPDDQGYGDLGVMGNPVIETPHLDRFARESATMTTFYVSPVCSPTRASLLTGRYHQRTRILDTFKGRSMMEPAETTLAELLRDAGYATGIFGKWHLGDNYPLRPTEQGFAESLIHRGGGLAQPSEPMENNRRYTDAILFRNNQRVQTRGYCTDVFFDAAMDFVDDAAGARRPFFVYLTPNAPHGPYHDVPAELYEKYKARDLSPVLLGNARDADTVARVFAMVENIDQNVGRLLDHLERRQLARDTIVIFLTDNGPNTRRFVGPLRGMKNEVHEGGIRTSFFLRWPSRLRAGVSSDRVAAHIDVVPTLLEAAGMAAPPGVQFDGRSFLPLLEGRGIAWPDRHLVLQAHRGDEPVPFHHIAVRTQRWKLVHPTGFAREAMPPDVPFELYDMAADPGERHNLATEHPQVVSELKAAYLTWFKDIASTRPDTFAPPRIVVGTPHEPETVLTSQDRRTAEHGWLLRFDRAADYEIQLRWKEPPGATSVAVRVGDESRDVKTVAGSTQARIASWRIPAGDAVLSLSAGARGNAAEPYDVLIRPVRR